MSRKPGQSRTYGSSGVHLERALQLVEWIKPLAWETHRKEVKSPIGGFAGGFQLDDVELLAAADGVGSKLLLTQELKDMRTLGVDLVAMNVNDLAVSGGEPLFFLDYLALPEIDEATVRSLVQGIVAGCRQAGCALLGGETAEMPDVYSPGTFDMSGFAVGRRVYTPPRPPRANDVVLGIASSGFHSNGFQLIRTVVKESAQSLTQPRQELDGLALGEALLRPTVIYVEVLKALWSALDVFGMAHITGGGLPDNLPRSLGPMGAAIDRAAWPLPREMQLIQDWGHIADSEMLRTFNCGIGLTAIIDNGQVERAVQIVQEHGLQAYPIGVVTEEGGIRIQ